MSLKRWVKAKEDLTHLRPDGTEMYRVPSGTRGMIYEASGELVVAFPMLHRMYDVKLLPLLEPIGDLPDVEDMINEIKDYEGHHSNRNGQYQFNIKTHAYDWPQIVEDYHDDTRKHQYLQDFLERELLNFVEETDGSLKALFPWIKDHHTAGRSGGWLILENLNTYENVSSLAEGWNEMVENVDQALDSGSKEDLRHAQSEANEFVQNVAELYFSLEYIKESIKYSIKETEEYIKTEECWEPLIEFIKEESEDDAA